MGRHGSIACLTCRTDFDCGYGSYSLWLDLSKDVAEFDASVAQDKLLGELTRNKAVRRVLAEHAGHDLVQWSSDWCEVNGKTGHLELDSWYAAPRVLIRNFAAFKVVHMEQEPQP